MDDQVTALFAAETAAAKGNYFLSLAALLFGGADFLLDSAVDRTTFGTSMLGFGFALNIDPELADL